MAKRNARKVQEAAAAMAAQAEAAEAAALQDMAEDTASAQEPEDTSIPVDVSLIPSLDTETLRTMADGVADALNGAEAPSAEVREEWAAYVVAARAELSSRDRGTMDAAREAAALAVQERAEKLASMAATSAPDAAQEAQEAPFCVACKRDILPGMADAGTTQDGQPVCSPDCAVAHAATLAALVPSKRPERTTRPTAAPVAPSTLYGLPVPPTRARDGWTTKAIWDARDAIWLARLASADVPDPVQEAEADTCRYCLQPYQDNSITVVGASGWSMHRVDAQYIGDMPKVAKRTAPVASSAAVATVSAEVAALQAAMAAQEERHNAAIAEMRAMLASATAPAPERLERSA